MRQLSLSCSHSTARPPTLHNRACKSASLNVVVLGEGGRGLASTVYTSNEGYGILTHLWCHPRERANEWHLCRVFMKLWRSKITNLRKKKLLVYASMKCCCVLVTTVSCVHTHEAHTRQFREREREEGRERDTTIITSYFAYFSCQILSNDNYN